ncbi:MAG: hypothetical protein IKY83_07030 [Proteobacteria bacterium]|nr:hypothetical protein [Pseudomonadota bacterium]
MKKTWTVIAMLAALSCASCNEEDGNKAACEEGHRICNASGVRQECVDGEYVSIPCPTGRTCNSGECLSIQECNPATTKPVCAGNSVKYCSESKWTYELTDCGALACTSGPNGAYCDPDSVTPETVCNAGAQRCTSLGAHQVCSNNTWVDSPCPSGQTCKAGSCVAEAACKEGATRCAAGEAVQECQDGVWKTISVCNQPGADTCRSGKCVEAGSIPNVGDSCDDNFTEVCDGNTGYYCHESKVETFECDSDAPCAVRASDNYSDCASECNAGDPAENVCVDYMGNPLSVKYTCDKTEDGSYAYFMGEYEVCKSSCSNGVCDGQTPTACTDGTKRCSGKDVQTCTNGEWVTSQSCDISCKSGACSSDPVTIPSVGDKCDDNFVELCDGNTGYYCSEGTVDTIDCDNDAPCAVRASDNYSDCAVACNAGDPAESVCMTYMGYPLAVQYTCDKTEAGGYGYFMGDYTFCESSCDNGVCDGQSPATCTEGAKKCSGKTVQTCKNGAWVDSQTCDEKCSNGACVSGGTGPTVGDKCDDNFVEVCDGNTGYYCSEGAVATIECDSDAPCAVRAADNYSDCAIACNAGDPAEKVCMTYMGYPLSVQYTCDKTEAGGYGYFMGDYEFCESSCNNGVCK